MSEEFRFRVMASLHNAWAMMPTAMDSLYPDEHMGEVRSTYRYSVHVHGWRSYIVIARLSPESASTTILTVIINPQVFTIVGAKAKFRQAEANRIYNALANLLTGEQA